MPAACSPLVCHFPPSCRTPTPTLPLPHSHTPTPHRFKPWCTSTSTRLPSLPQPLLYYPSCPRHVVRLHHSASPPLPPLHLHHHHHTREAEESRSSTTTHYHSICLLATHPHPIITPSRQFFNPSTILYFYPPQLKYILYIQYSLYSTYKTSKIVGSILTDSGHCNV